VLNLADPQFVQSTSNRSRAPPEQSSERAPASRIGPHPLVQPRGGAAPSAGFRPAAQPPVRIMSNPARGRGWNVPRNDERSAARVLADPAPTSEELHQRSIRETFNIRGAPRGRGVHQSPTHHPAPAHTPRILARGRAVSQPSQPAHHHTYAEPSVNGHTTINSHSERGSFRARGGPPRGRARGRGRGVAPVVQS
jgi:hypothetical protein